MIFVTLGTQKFQFNRLLQYIDDLIEEKVIDDDVTAQIGDSSYYPKHFQYVRFLDKEKFLSMLDSCDFVITHGGTGSIINVLKRNKKVIAVPRLYKYGEHVDNHQIQLLKEFETMGLISTAMDKNQLRDILKTINSRKYNRYISNTDNIINIIDNYISNIGLNVE